MAKTNFDRSNGFGIVGWAFLILVIYVFVSLAIAITTNDTTCRAGFDRHWQLAPPQWECR